MLNQWIETDEDLAIHQAALEKQLLEVRRARAQLQTQIKRQASTNYINNDCPPLLDHVRQVMMENYSSLQEHKLGMLLRNESTTSPLRGTRQVSSDEAEELFTNLEAKTSEQQPSEKASKTCAIQ